MGRRNWIEWLLLSVAAIAAVAMVVAYYFSFHGAPPGGPSEWSECGDYFSGMLNPVIGIVTVILIVLTLRTTRREAADTRHQMEQQIEHLERQALLSDMHKRLDGALSEWNRLLDQQASSAERLSDVSPGQ